MADEYSRQELARNPAARLGYKSCTGWYHSIKAGHRFPYESLLERDAMLIADIDPGILSFSPQPETIHWSDENGRQRRYTPDLLVKTSDGRVSYRQVKPRIHFDADPTLSGRLTYIENECERRGVFHEMWFDDDIRRQPRLANVRRIRATASVLTEDGRQAVRVVLGVRGIPTTLGVAMEDLGGRPEDLNQILGMVAIGELAIDLNAVLNMDTRLWLGSKRK